MPPTTPTMHERKTNPGPESLETLKSRCMFYREECGIPAFVQPELQRITVTSNTTLAGLRMPASTAIQVRNILAPSGIHFGPVISHPRAMTWTLLVNADVSDDHETYAALFRRYAALTRPGTPITLPSPHPQHADLRYWIEPPTSERPSGAVVVQAIQDCGPILGARPR